MQLQALIDEIGPDAVSTDPADLVAHARDWWPLAMLRERRGDDLDAPAAVVRPSTVGGVQAVLRWAEQTRTPVVPFGGGSGVCGGAQSVAGSVALDTRRLDRVEIDERALSATAQAGVMGPALETALAARGLTLGHFPQSIEISTLGGWLATRSAGQKSLRYGRIEDMVLGLEAVLPGGRLIRTKPAPASAAGPDVARLFLGSEGTLGVITEATLAVRPAPARTTHAAYELADFSTGLEVLRRISREGLRPAVCRLYDPADAWIAFRESAPGGAVLILRFEDGPVVRAEERAVKALAGDAGARRLPPGLAKRWWAHRNEAVRTLGKIMFERALGETGLVDTMEVAGFWPVDGLYRSVREALEAHADVVGCHASHLYPQGTCLYFTFVFTGSADDRVAEERYLAAWDAGMRATLAAGGAITHHHGVGLLRTPWLGEELGSGLEVLRAVKRALDPNGIMNPGKLGL